MATVSTQQPLVTKGTNVLKKMKRFLLFALFLGLFMFSMSILFKARIQSSYHYSDGSISNLADEIKELKKTQEWNKKAIERLYSNQQRIVSDQSDLRQIKDSLFEEISRVENIALQNRETYRTIQAYLSQQDSQMKSLMKNVEGNKAQHQRGSQDKNFLMMELRKTQNGLAERLEAFRRILQSFEININNNNKKLAEDVREIKAWVAENSISKEDIPTVIQSSQNAHRQLINEVNNQKNIINQLAQNSLKQGNEVKEISRVINGLKEYTLETLQQLGQQNAINERRISGVEKGKFSQGSSVKSSSDSEKLVTEFKNFKEYTMEALQELRAYNNKNTKRINHIKSKESDNSMASISDMVSQEIEKFFNKLSDGKLLEKILEETNISMRELHTFINIVKMLAEGDINGVMATLNQLAGGNLMEQLLNAKKGLLKEFKPVIDILTKLSGQNLEDVMKYASWINNLVGGNSENESYGQSGRVNNQKQQKPQKKEFVLEDLLKWLD